MIIDSKDIKVQGARKDTIKFVVNGITYVKFFAKDLIEEIKSKNGKLTMTILGRGTVNRWMGKEIPQILVKEIEFKETSIYDF